MRFIYQWRIQVFQKGEVLQKGGSIPDKNKKKSGILSFTNIYGKLRAKEGGQQPKPPLNPPSSQCHPCCAVNRAAMTKSDDPYVWDLDLAMRRRYRSSDENI
jgi:hypothetical protein